MANQGNIMFYDICRLCLDGRGEHSMFGNEELPKDIFACIGVRVKSEDKLPHNICNLCLDIITKAKGLRKLASDNNTHLRLLFDEDKNSDDDDDPGRLVIDEPSDRDCTETIQSILDEGGRLIDVTLKVERDEDEPIRTNKENNAKIIGVRKDLFDISTPTVSPDSSSMVKEVSKSTPRKRVLGVGKKDVSNVKEKFHVEYQCPTCHKEFDNYKKLYMHQRLHNRSLACPDCPKKFATKGDLRKHQRTHTGERPFLCNVCDKGFAQNVTLKQHKEAVHAGIAPDEDST